MNEARRLNDTAARDRAAGAVIVKQHNLRGASRHSTVNCSVDLINPITDVFLFSLRIARKAAAEGVIACNATNAFEIGNDIDFHSGRWHAAACPYEPDHHSTNSLYVGDQQSSSDEASRSKIRANSSFSASLGSRYMLVRPR